MKPLNAPDKHYLLAAQGWIELGNNAEALIELDKISSAHRGHPDVVQVRRQLCGSVETEDTVFDIARTICALEPLLPVAADKIQNSPSRRPLSQSKSTAALTARLPELFAIPYNLACYACQLGSVKEAWEWFRMAVEMSDEEQIRELALNDPDLAPLWDRIRSM
jgi:hypothetical protein